MPDKNLNLNDLFNQGKAAFAAKEYEKAIAIFYEVSDMLEAAKTDPEADEHLLSLNTILENSLHNALLVAHIKTQKLDLALNNLNTALKTNPDKAVTHFNGGLLYQYRGDYPKALQHYQNAIDLKNNKAHFNKGKIHYTLGQYKETLNEYIKGYAHLKIKEKDVIQDNINAILQKSADILLEIPKKTLLEAMALLPISQRIAVLTECINKDTALGERFHKKEGLLACSIHKKDSNLGKAYAELIKLKPDFVMSKPTTIMAYGTLHTPTQTKPHPESPRSSISKKK